MSRLMEELSSFPSTASTSQEDHESNSESTSSRILRVTLLSSEWRSTKGGLSTINRELSIQLAKHPSVEVSVYLPQCSEEDKQVAFSHNVQLIDAEEMPGYDPVDWLSFLPENHSVDCVIGHGAVLGRQVQGIKRQCKCKWIQVVHTAPEELGIIKSYADAISRGEKKHQAEVKLCEKADQVVAVGPKLAEAFSRYLRACGKDQDVLNLTPGIFSEFSDIKQATEERKTFSVLVFGRGDSEDFQLKGYDIAARAIAELKDEPQPYKLLFVGAPSGEEEKVKDLLLQQGIDRSQLTVRCFNESREQLARLFCKVDLAIMPSRTEGFGLAALEALSAGLPVLVSGNSGFGEALREVPIGSNCVVESEDPKDWANAIRVVRKKNRKLRLREARLLQGEYAEMYNWQDHCNKLVERMFAISQGPNADEQNLSKKATVICQDENPSSSEKRLHKGSKKGKRPLSPSSTPASKVPECLGDEESASEKSATDPPQVSARQIRNKDLPAKSKPFGDCQIEVDILLLTVMKEDTCEDCEFLSCLAYLNPDFCKIHHPDLGYVYLGDMGEDDLKLNVAVMKCYEGSSSTGGSIVVVTNAVKVLKPKAVFCVGSCSGLNVTKVSLGDVVVLKKLVTYAFSKVTENGIEELGVKVPLKPHISKLILSAGEGWKPPLKDPGTLEVKIHRGTFLSGPEVINNHKRCNALIERFPEAVAIEREGEGLYAAAHNLDIEWVVIKGISGYADGRKVKDSWRAFASFMAASLTAYILSDTIAFQALPHYGSASSSGGLQPVKKGKMPLPPSGITRLLKDKVSGAKRSKSSKKGKRPLSSSNTPKHPRLLRDEGSSEGLQPVKKGITPLPPSGTPDPKHPRLSKDEGALPETKSQKQSYIFSRIINSEGGMMIGDGVKLVVPPGAVEKPVTISAAFEDPFRYYRLIVQKDLENDIVFAAPVIKLRPSGQVFKIPVKLTTTFTISVSKKTDVIVLHGTEGRDGISWQDVTHYSTIDEASEEVTTEMEHFTVGLVLVRRTLICLKSIAYWLTSFSFHYTLSVLMKKSDKGSKLNLVLMSQEFYNEEFYREHSDTSALVQLKRKGFKELDVPPIDGQHDKCVYNNEKLRVSICLEENCKLVDTEERRITVQSAVWWARGHVEEVNIDRNIDISVIRVNVKIQRENGQDFSLYFGESELLCIRSLLGVQGAIFNLKPIARKLLVPEQTFTQIEKFWKDEDKQMEIVLEEWKEKTDEKQNHHNLSEILESLKHEDYKITERGQMHIRNLRQVEGKDQQCENFEIKKLYFQKEMQAVFKMALNDCLIELEGSKLDDYAERQKSIQERYDMICSSSASERITKICPIDIPKLVQDIKEIFHHKSKTDRPNGLRGLFEEEVDAFRFKIQEAQSNKNLGGVVSEVGNVLAKLCENNRGDRTTAAQIQMWSRSLMTPLMLDFLEQFFKRCPEDCRLLKRLRNLSEKQNEIMDRSRDGDELLLKDASNTAKRLMDFAKFEPSKLVRFQLKSSAGSDVACNSGIIGHERNHDVFSQEFTITYGPSEKLQIHPIAWTVRFDGEALEEKPERCSCILSFTGTRLKLSYDWPFKKLTASNVQSAGDFNTPQDSTATSSSTTAEKRKAESVLTEGSAPKKCKFSPSEARGATQSEATPGRGANASTIRPGNPEAEVLERLSIKLGSKWKALARRLKFEDGDITSFEAESGGLAEKVFKMLREWKYREGSEASYSVLYSALSDQLVGRKDLAETFCLNH